MTWTVEQRLSHPAGGEIYGHVPELVIRRGPTFPAGAIYLKYGEHRGRHRGFGFQHIWKEHFSGIDDHNVAMALICARVAEALQPRAPLHYETGDRLEVYRLKAGCVILELRPSEGPSYSVVSAGYVTRNAKGPRVGALVRVEPAIPKQPS